MPISRENNLIFVHIPKNAGTSIQEKFKMEQLRKIDLKQ